MKKIINNTVLLMLAISGLFTSCKKSGCTDSRSLNFDADADKDDGTCQLAGLGGNTTIVAFPTHHNEPIYNLDSTYNYPDSAYVKFNATDQPANLSDYDAVFAGDDFGEAHVHMEGLKPGKYYIFMTGLDTSLAPPNQRVKGGIPYTLTQSTGEVDLQVPVTED